MRPTGSRSALQVQCDGRGAQVVRGLAAGRTPGAGSRAHSVRLHARNADNRRYIRNGSEEQTQQRFRELRVNIVKCLGYYSI